MLSFLIILKRVRRCKFASVSFILICCILFTSLTLHSKTMGSSRPAGREPKNEVSPALLIDTSFKAMINGIEHALFIKSANSQNPILLILHGGPGFSDFYFWQTYNKDLQQNFTVVNYDQRGTGLSYTSATLPASMNYKQLTDDAYKIIQLLKTMFKQQQVILMAHSAGTIIGVYLTSLYPADIHSFVSVGQVVGGYDNEKACLEYVISQASKRADKAALNELNAFKDHYPSGNAEVDLPNLKTLRKWNRAYYGDFCAGSSMDSLFAGLDSAVLKKVDFDALNEGEAFSMKYLWSEIVKVKFLNTHTVFKVPVYFVVGKCDYNTPFKLTEHYYKKIRAPKKEIIYFTHSGHYMPFVEPAKFNSFLIGEFGKKK